MDFSSVIPSGFRGCACITQNGTAVLEKASGLSDLANNIPNTMQTRFATASAGKAFVAVAVLNLIERGKLHFEDTLCTLLALDWHQIDPGVTVRQLLTHTSGVPDYFDESIMDEYEELWIDFPNYRIRKNSDLLPLFLTKPMLYSKGSKFQYNNTGYVLLAMILEQITNQEFDEVLNELVFAPAEMCCTGYYELDRLPAHCANNYIFDQDGRWRTNIFSVDAKGTGAGGAFTTVEDILNFWDSLKNYRLLSKAMTENMLRIHSGDDENEDGKYGYGVWMFPRTDGSYFPYFQGCDPGVSFVSLLDRKTDTTAVLVSNYGDNVWKIMRNIVQQLNGSESI